MPNILCFTKLQLHLVLLSCLIVIQIWNLLLVIDTSDTVYDGMPSRERHWIIINAVLIVIHQIPLWQYDYTRVRLIALYIEHYDNTWFNHALHISDYLTLSLPLPMSTHAFPHTHETGVQANYLCLSAFCHWNKMNRQIMCVFFWMKVETFSGTTMWDWY